jgi:RNA polymerase sigma-70 factor (sigma-E family)
MTTTPYVDSGGRVDPRGGDGTATFDDFVAGRSRALLRTAYLLTHDHALAEDLLQTSLAKAWFAWKKIHGEPEPYVRKILVNTYATWWRRKWNGEQPTETLPEGVLEDVSEPTDLWAAMERLPRRMRAVIVLRYFEDLTEVQTADVLGCSVGTVKSASSRGLVKLRGALRNGEIEQLRGGRPA